ncbi:hypothetical protein ACWD5R_09475 [Streptomyces sp. NPDC002514]|uniref:hypothetical protein n=1 Tax=unclassified Streptomyces TaxID=2593676 RepID=UPI0036B60DA4
MPRRPPARAARTALAVALLSVAAAGCGDTGGLRAAGPTPTAAGPARLWPGLEPASSPAWPYDVASREPVRGVTVPGDDIHQVDPVAVVRAEIAAHPDSYGSKGPYHGAADRIADCAAGGDRSRCPLLPAYYRDLTGNGRDELALGFRLYPTNQTAIRVYTVEGHRLVQVLADNDAIVGVELAGRTVIVRSPAGISGYEYRTTWTWDPQQRAMVFARDEFLRTGGGGPARTPSSSPAPSPSAQGS